MSLNIVNDYLNFDGLETITYCSRTGNGSAPTDFAQSTVNRALRRVQSKQDQLLAGVELGTATLVWNLWTPELHGTIPKVGDVVQESSGTRWTVLHAEPLAMGTGVVANRYRLTCTKERS